MCLGSRWARSNFDRSRSTPPSASPARWSRSARRPNAHRHRLSVVYGPGPFRIVADPARLEQIVVNLLGNAVKYTESGGAIAVSVTRDDDVVVITVRDNGLGIDAALLPHIFDPFIQADVSPGRARGGLGIGLTLVRSLVSLHGGTVTATSGGLGLGSAFTVRLPIATDPVANMGAPPRASEPKTAPTAEVPARRGRRETAC